jgi:hypothetical protein
MTGFCFVEIFLTSTFHFIWLDWVICLLVIYLLIAVWEESRPVLGGPRPRFPLLHVPVRTVETTEWLPLHTQGFLPRNIQWKGNLHSQTYNACLDGALHLCVLQSVSDYVHFYSLFFFGALGRDYVCLELRPLTGPLSTVHCHTDSGKQRNSEKNLSQCHFVHHKFHVDSPLKKAGTPRWEAGD